MNSRTRTRLVAIAVFALSWGVPAVLGLFQPSVVDAVSGEEIIVNVNGHLPARQVVTWKAQWDLEGDGWLIWPRIPFELREVDPAAALVVNFRIIINDEVAFLSAIDLQGGALGNSAWPEQQMLEPGYELSKERFFGRDGVNVIQYELTVERTAEHTGVASVTAGPLFVDIVPLDRHADGVPDRLQPLNVHMGLIALIAGLTTGAGVAWWQRRSPH